MDNYNIDGFRLLCSRIHLRKYEEMSINIQSVFKTYFFLSYLNEILTESNENFTKYISQINNLSTNKLKTKKYHTVRKNCIKNGEV
jgi:hypothetical protein